MLNVLFFIIIINNIRSHPGYSTPQLYMGIQNNAE